MRDRPGTEVHVRVLVTGFLALMLCAGCGTRSDRAEKRPAVRDGFVTADDGVRLYYRVVGDGPRTVLLPGHFLLAPDFERLASGRTLIFYDMRNRGRSDSVSAAQANSIQQDVADLETIRRHFQADSVDLVGYSYLGLMVILYAMEHPAQVRRIVQLSPVPRDFATQYPEGLGPADFQAAMDSTALKELRRLRTEDSLHIKDPQQYCEREWLVSRFTLVGDPAHVDRLNGSQCHLPNEWPTRLAGHYARHFESVQKLKVSAAEVARVTVPVLTIHGTIDRNAPYGAGREWGLTLPDARLVTIQGAAHCTWADDPETVFTAVGTFLSGSWPPNAEKVTSLVPR